MSDDLFINDNGVHRLMTEVERENLLALRQEFELQESLFKAEKESKAAQKAAILERIGLTEEELQIVLGA
jgi:hypothetical protein